MPDVTDAEQAARDDHCCYLTTTGRRTRRLHRVEIWYAARGDTLYMLSGGGRSSDWVRNVCADSAVTVEVEGVVLPGHARVIEAGAEAEQARSLVFAKYAPRYGGDLTEWRQRALPVAIDLKSA